MVLTKAVRATVLAAALALAGCGKQCEIKELHVDARQPIPVGQGVPVDAVIRFPPPEALYRWRAETGEFEPQESAASSTTYRARRPGVDRAMLEVVKRNVVNCEKTVEIRSVAASAGEPGTTPPGGVGGPAPAAETPGVRITETPPYDPTGGELTRATIAGVASGAKPRQRIVIYACTDVCYVQPLVAAPFTDIGPGGSWSTWTHTGERYVALLVGPDSKPPPVIAAPGTYLDGVVARAVADGSGR